MLTPARLIPAGNASDWNTPRNAASLVVQGVQPAVHPGGHRDTTGHPTLRAIGCLAAQQLTREQDQAVEGEEDRRRFRCGDTERSVVSRASPRMPTGMVAMLISTARRWGDVRTVRVRSTVTKPPMMTTQSRA